MAPAERDAADEAMVARAHERFAAGEAARTAARRAAGGALPNLVVVGGLKCGTTSLHHYLNLHPEVEMSRPKELNFFVAELNWPLGPEWYASHFSGRAPVRGESSPHYTNRPRFEGVAERMRSVLADARLVYMVRDPIDRMLSHYLHNVGGGYDDRALADAFADPDSAYVTRSRYFFQLEPYLEAFGAERIEIVAPRGAEARPPGHDAPRVRLPRRRPRLQLGAVRARVGDRHRQGRRALPADGPGGAAPRPAGARPQLRPPARVAALAGRASRSRSRRRRGAEAGGPGGAQR